MIAFAGRLRLAAPAVLALVLAGCWDSPVRESMVLSFDATGGARATLAVELDSAGEWRMRERPLVERRLARKAAELESGSDPAVARLAALDCGSSGGAWERSGADLVRFEHWVECSDAVGIVDLFGDVALAVDLERAGFDHELSIVPLGGGSATRAERERTERELERWSVALERYFAAAFRLAERAEARPERARDLWIAGVGDLAGDPARPLGAADAALAEELSEALGEAFGAFNPLAGEAEALDELVRRVFDPIPARLVVELPARPSAVAGFEALSDRRFAAPDGGVLGALAQVGDRWLEPDPLRAVIGHLRSGSDDPMDVAPFAAADPRRAARPPTRIEILAALVAALEEQPELRLAWTLPPPPGTTDGNPQ